MKLIRIGLILCIVGVINAACHGTVQTDMQATITSPSASVPNGPGSSTKPTNSGTSGILDDEVKPLYGFANLQRAFSPDPFIIGVGAGGTIDTSAMNLGCGFSTNAPTFAFNLSGGASEGFLRIYFVPSDNGIEPKLIVHTPDQEWICKDHSTNSSGKSPVLDIEYAASGKYSIWVGMPQNDTYAPGMLYITETSKNTP